MCLFAEAGSGDWQQPGRYTRFQWRLAACIEDTRDSRRGRRHQLLGLTGAQYASKRLASAHPVYRIPPEADNSLEDMSDSGRGCNNLRI